MIYNPTVTLTVAMLVGRYLYGVLTHTLRSMLDSASKNYMQGELKGSLHVDLSRHSDMELFR